MKNDYSDIIGLPVHEPDPDKHPRMSREARAAQFAPFAALTGYDDAIKDTAQENADRIASYESSIVDEILR